MSDTSQSSDSSSRPLRAEELELVRSLLSAISSNAELENTLSESRVTDMSDGGMGSIRFARPQSQSMGKALVEAQYVDSDGVLVSIALNVDKDGQLFEVDFWKVDFSPLRRYPKPSDLLIS